MDLKSICADIAFVSIILFSLILSFTSPVRSEDRGEKQSKVKIFDVKKGTFEMVDKVNKTEEEWKGILTPDEFYITRKKGTERAFSGKYHDLKKKGIYKCVACGTDLFSSAAKYDSGTGWPSFYEPVADENVYNKEDNTLFMKRTEVLCSRCDSHLGHVFDDGPAPTNKRYCMNSAALRFVEDEK